MSLDSGVRRFSEHYEKNQNMVDSISVISPGWRATDANGAIITDGVLYFYEAGTSTPLEVFSDANLTASLGVSVSCDSSGYPVTSGNAKTIIYAGVRSYKIKLIESSTGVKIWEHDYVRAANQVPLHPTTIGHYTSTTGIGTITLGDTISGCRSFVESSIQDGYTVYIIIKDGDYYEESHGVYNATAGTVTRVLMHSTTGALLNLSGNALVYLNPHAEYLQNGSWTAYTPTLTAENNGTFTATASGRYLKIGKTVFIELNITITNSGTAINSCYASLPFAAVGSQVLAGREIAVVAVSVTGLLQGSQCNIRRYDAGTIFVNNYNVILSGVYECS